MKKVKNIKENYQKFIRSMRSMIDKSNEDGFSLVEVIIALVVFLIVMLGLVVVFTYAVNYNSGNNSRAQALAVLQQQVELSRSAKFTRNKTDDATTLFDMTGGTKTPKTVTSADGNRFKIQTVIDDDPSTTAVDVVVPPTAATLKEITITVTLDSPTPGWQTSVPAKVVLRRARAN